VINISGGGISYPPLDDAVDRAVAADIPVVVAALNDNTDACTASPAGAPQAITVAAVDRSGQRAGFSDFGSCVDLFAPGVDVLSALNTSDTATAYDSGTSMATPHLAGLLLAGAVRSGGTVADDPDPNNDTIGVH
jgi:subtilisin family serine protease